jgi:murein DD-endopeptidase MepM/ murein hydrolase activator NlpD
MKVAMKPNLTELSVGILTRILISALILGILPGVIFELMGSEAIAATKSLIAPPEVVSEPNEPAPISNREANLEPTVTNPVLIQENQRSESQQSTERKPEIRPEILIESDRKSTSDSIGSLRDTSTQIPEKISNSVQNSETSVILENRASGCWASDRQLKNIQGNIQANLCNLPIESKNSLAYTDRVNSSYGSYSFSGIRATVRPLDRSGWNRTAYSAWTKVNLPFNLSINLPGIMPRNLGDRGMTFPLSVPAVISSSFGYRIHPITSIARFHQGTDIAAAEGTPVLAVFSGKVEISGWMGGLGLAVVISHESDRETRYGHLSEVFVQPGQWVEQGTAIGLVGSTGMSTGPHLHFELWQQQLGEWVATDPAPYLTLALAEFNRFLAQQTKPNPA